MRAILHSDLNSYYASVEIMLNPALRDLPVAVCGSRETRHGIVLAKSEIAKRAGVQTGMAIWEAKRCCGDLVVVPPQYELYIRFSRLTREIYARFTGQVEPFGMDECWLDVTGAPGGTPLEIAEKIRAATKTELGLTVSIGISFNKVFAKLGSDMRKPDAITEIPYEHFREIVWPLPAGEMLGVGPATRRKLEKRSIDTIGQLAQTDPQYLRDWFGVNGLRLWRHANGLDESPVAPLGYSEAAKSFGHGVTTSADLYNDEEVRNLLYALAPRISRKLRENGVQARTVEIEFRDNELIHYGFRSKLARPTQSTRELVESAMVLFRQKYVWERPLMSFTLRAADLISERRPRQLDFFGEEERRQRQEKLERAADEIRARFGNDAIQTGSAMLGKLRRNDALEFVRMPGRMHGF
ncbi:MAG: DNA polymerase IV [Clostridia bacterium]|nr:DNA polymerase IV [Clostridia bacterium]